MRGVKPALMSLRMREWLGGSDDTNVWPRCSSPVGEMLAPSSELNVRQSRARACSSGWPSTTQNSMPSGARVSVVRGWRQTGCSSRSSRNSSCGKPSR